VSSLQKCSTYELLSYSTVVEWAEVLGIHQIVDIMSSRQYDRVPTDAHLRAIMPQLTQASARMSVGVSFGQNLPSP
ncbi:MAG TPA: DUF892 family protein, partial [Fimbriimonas sp.]|nr:DUF892 family protein [Fimbriimonas sp.]